MDWPTKADVYGTSARTLRLRERITGFYASFLKIDVQGNKSTGDYAGLLYELSLLFTAVQVNQRVRSYAVSTLLFAAPVHS